MTGDLVPEYYNAFVNDSKKCRFIEIGRCSYAVAENWGYLKGNCYCTMIYDRGLSNEEIENMCDKMEVLYN